MKRLVLDFTAAELAQAAVCRGETLDVETEAQRIVSENPYIDGGYDEVVATLQEELAAAQAWKLGMNGDVPDARR